MAEDIKLPFGSESDNPSNRTRSIKEFSTAPKPFTGVVIPNKPSSGNNEGSSTPQTETDKEEALEDALKPGGVITVAPIINVNDINLIDPPNGFDEIISSNSTDKERAQNALNHALVRVGIHGQYATQYLENDLARALENMATTLAGYALYLADLAMGAALYTTSLECLTVAAESQVVAEIAVAGGAAAVAAATVTVEIPLKAATTLLGAGDVLDAIAGVEEAACTVFLASSNLTEILAEIITISAMLAAQIAQFEKFFAEIEKKLQEVEEAVVTALANIKAIISETIANLNLQIQNLQKTVENLLEKNINETLDNAATKAEQALAAIGVEVDVQAPNVNVVL